MKKPMGLPLPPTVLTTLFATALAMTLTACGGSSNSNSSTTAAGSSNPAGGSNTLSKQFPQRTTVLPDGTDIQDGVSSDGQYIAMSIMNGNSNIDGLSGVDTAVFQGKYQEYSVNILGKNVLVQDSVSARNGLVTLKNIEQLAFSDKTLEFTAYNLTEK